MDQLAVVLCGKHSVTMNQKLNSIHNQSKWDFPFVTDNDRQKLASSIRDLPKTTSPLAEHDENYRC